MDEKFECLNALRQPMNVGDYYGWSSTKNGYSRTTVGKFRSITKSGLITLDVVDVHTFLYGKEREHLWEPAKVVNMRPHMLFPVNYTEE